MPGSSGSRLFTSERPSASRYSSSGAKACSSWRLETPSRIGMSAWTWTSSRMARTSGGDGRILPLKFRRHGSPRPARVRGRQPGQSRRVAGRGVRRAAAAPAAGAALREPRELERARNVVLVILDGLGDNYLMRQGKGGELARRRRGALTSVFPSTTASAITTSYTGCTPVEHGITGWYTYFGEAGYVAAPLPFRTRGDMLPLREKGFTPERAFTARPIFESMQARAIIVSSAEIIASEYNLYHCAAAERRAVV